MSIQELIVKFKRLIEVDAPITRKIKKPELFFKALDDLDQLIEMNEAKKSIIQQIQYLIVTNNQDDKDQAFDGHVLHTLISGPPGVGKTRLGQILARIWLSMDLIKKPKLVPRKMKPEDLLEAAILNREIRALDRKLDENKKTFKMINTIAKKQKDQLWKLKDKLAGVKKLVKKKNKKVKSVSKLTIKNSGTPVITISHFNNPNLISKINNDDYFDKLNDKINDDDYFDQEDNDYFDQLGDLDKDDCQGNCQDDRQDKDYYDQPTEEDYYDQPTEEDYFNQPSNNYYDTSKNNTPEKKTQNLLHTPPWPYLSPINLPKTPPLVDKPKKSNNKKDSLYNDLSKDTRLLRFTTDDIIDITAENMSTEEAQQPPEEPFTVVSRDAFVAGYLGQTALKTRKLLEDNLGKVLFIDEAYSLVNSDRDSFGLEALTVLNQFMSEYSDNIIIIFAGYKDLMQKTIFSAQPGLQRRVSWCFNVEAYTPTGLSKIFDQQLSLKGWEIRSSDLIKFFENNKDKFPNYGGDTEKLAYYCKLEYANYKFESTYESLISGDIIMLDNLINDDILNKALLRLTDNNSNKKDNNFDYKQLYC